MIYIKRFLYLLFMIVITIFGRVSFFITMITFPFVSMVDYIMHGKLTKDYVWKVYEWADSVLNKLKPE